MKTVAQLLREDIDRLHEMELLDEAGWLRNLSMAALTAAGMIANPAAHAQATQSPIVILLCKGEETWHVAPEVQAQPGYVEPEGTKGTDQLSLRVDLANNKVLGARIAGNETLGDLHTSVETNPNTMTVKLNFTAPGDKRQVAQVTINRYDLFYEINRALTQNPSDVRPDAPLRTDVQLSSEGTCRILKPQF
jgi:hypothetical protein